MSKEPTIHKDVLGRELAVGDCVAFSAGSRRLRVGKIDKLHKVMVGVRCKGTTSNQDPGEVVKLDGPEVTMYILRGNKA